MFGVVKVFREREPGIMYRERSGSVVLSRASRFRTPVVRVPDSSTLSSKTKSPPLTTLLVKGWTTTVEERKGE